MTGSESWAFRREGARASDRRAQRVTRVRVVSFVCVCLVCGVCLLPALWPRLLAVIARTVNALLAESYMENMSRKRKHGNTAHGPRTTTLRRAARWMGRPFTRGRVPFNTRQLETRT